jgi:iron complex outermembrane receptor protein
MSEFNVSGTGTNIRRLDAEKVLPVTVLGGTDMELRDAQQPADMLTALPEVTGLPGNETATLGATARGDNSTVSLRGIPSSNTLMLLNGRRLAPHPISQSEAGVPALSVNVNQLPNRGLSRVEVLRDGASSIYGSDAVAGVINFITDRNFQGDRLDLRYGATKYGDGAEYRATFQHGQHFDDGKARVTITADLSKRGSIFARDRSFAANADNSSRAPAPWNVSTNTTYNLTSATSQYGNYSLGALSADGTTFTAARPAGIPATLAATSGQFYLVPTGTGSGVGIATATPSRVGVTHDYYWNNNLYRVIQPKSTRGNVFASGEYDLNPRITAFTDLSLYQAHSITYREPDGITASTDGNIIVPINNPFNPFGSRFFDPTGAPNADGSARLTGTPSAVLISNKRLTDLATRTDTVTDSVYRGVAGLRGKFFQTWSWECAVLWSDARVIEYEAGPSRKSLLINAVNQSDPAKAYNPFNYLFAVQSGTLAVTGPAPAAAESIQTTFRSAYVRNGITKLGSGDFHLSGDLFPLWGGNAVGAAFGGEFRYEAFDDYRPPYTGLNPPGSGLDPAGDDFLGFSPNSDTHANRHVASLYSEAIVPLVGRNFTLPAVQSLELSASGRYESYTDFGQTTKPKLGVNWKPVSWVMVRASYNKGFHAPDLPELFTGTLIRTVTGSTDTYRSAVTGLPTDGPSNRRSIASGNPHLRPETSTGKSAGVVIDVPMVKGLSVSIDYWQIAQQDVIAASGSIADDTAALQAATQAGLAAGQNINSINLGSGTANYRGDRSVVRLPVTANDQAFFAAYNAAQVPGNQRAVVGAIANLNSTYFNKSLQFVNGFDLNLTYLLPATRCGTFTFATDWTYLADFHSYNAAGQPRIELRGTNASAIGGADPVWRGTTGLTWKHRQWGAGIAMYYIGHYSDAGATTTAAIYGSLGNPSYITPVFTSGAYSYRDTVHDSKSYNVFVTYKLATDNRFLRNTSLRLGVNNVLNAKPPLSSDSRGYDPAVYNGMARGLSWSVDLIKKL